MTVVLKSFPDLGKLFAGSKIIDELYAIYPGENMFLLSINRAIELKKSNSAVFSLIFEHYNKAPNEVIQALGADLMNRILNLKIR